MNRPCHAVEPSRLKLLLDDGLPGPEKRRLESHLEACAACRDSLEEMAGEPGWWDDVRKFVPPELAPSPPGPTGDHSSDDDEDDGPRRSDPPKPGGDIWLDFLAPSDDPEALGRLGNYKVLGVLGRGGMGIVLKAFDPALDRMVALKVLSPALAASGAARHRFAREARAAAAVVHEHVVAIHAVSSWRGLPYLVMQYIPGRSLQDRIDRDGPLEVEEILRIGMQAAAGLAAAHAHGLVHRDVKPSNILLEDGLERVKITDFGLARAADDASLTQSGVLAGTPQYMAPEQAQGEGIDHRADLFSLGSVLYAMCAGRPPFRAETTVAVIRRVCDERPRPLREINPDVPAWLAAIVEKLHAKDPSQRFASATELAEVLATRLAQLRRPDDGPLLQVPQTAGRWNSSSWWAVAAGILVVIAGVGGAEAGGFTTLRALVGTIFRIRTAEGTLVIDVSDPEVKVRVDGNEVVISGTGPQEFRYRPGPHRVVATRGGRSVLEKVVTIERGGKELVAISQEGRPAPTGAAERAVERAGESSDPRLLQERIRRLEDQLAGMQAAPSGIVALPPPPASAAPIPIPFAPSAPVPAAPVPPAAAPVPEAPAPGGAVPLPPGIPTAPAPSEAAPAPGPVPAPPGGVPAPGSPVPEPRPTEVPPASAVSSGPASEVSRPPTLVAAGSADPFNGPLNPAPSDRVRSRDVTRRNASPPVVNAEPFARLLHVFPVSDESPAFEYPNGAVRAVAYSPAIRDLALVTRDGSLSVWSRDPRGVRAEFLTPNDPVSLAAFSPDGKTVATCDNTKGDRFQSVKLWGVADRLERGEESSRFAWFVRTPLALAFSFDGKALAAAGRDGSMQLFDLTTGNQRATYKGHDGAVRSLAFMPDGQRLVSAGVDKTIQSWVVRTGRHDLEPAVSLSLHSATNCLAVAPDGMLLAFSLSSQHAPPAVGQDDLFNSIDQTSRWIRLSHGHADGRGDRILKYSRHAILALAFSPDGRIIASAGGRHEGEGEARLWDVSTGDLLADLKGHRRTVECLSFSPDGKTLVTAGGWRNGPGEVKLWDLSTFATGWRPPRPDR